MIALCPLLRSLLHGKIMGGKMDKFRSPLLEETQISCAGRSGKSRAGQQMIIAVILPGIRRDFQ